MYEGEVVYVLHRVESDDPLSSQGTRCVVHQGTCYGIVMPLHGKSPLPEVYLPKIDPRLIAEVHPLRKEQWSKLEEGVWTALLGGHEFVNVSLSLHKDKFPLGYTGQKKLN